jgi:hypothetical protein
MNALFAILEVMDKEPSLTLTLIVGGALGLAGFFAGRRRPWLALLPLAALLVFGLARLSELQDPFVGPAIREEAGNGYALLTYVAVAVGIALCVAGALQGWLRRPRGLTGA